MMVLDSVVSMLTTPSGLCPLFSDAQILRQPEMAEEKAGKVSGARIMLGKKVRCSIVDMRLLRAFRRPQNPDRKTECVGVATIIFDAAVADNV